MSETINDRMQMLVDKHFKGNKSAFAKAIGFAPASMSSYLGKQRRSKPSVDMIASIVSVLDVDARWLLTGKETMKEIYESHGDYSPVSNREDIAVVVNESNNESKLFTMLLAEKDRRIDDLTRALTEKEQLISSLFNNKK